MHQDADRCYAAMKSRDARFDGWFVTAVMTTGIYCRPSCPVRLPLARNVRFHLTSAAARLGYTARQLVRLLNAEVGAGPLALARAQRVQNARFGEVAFAAGFASIRQSNNAVRSALRRNAEDVAPQRLPTPSRERRNRPDAGAAATGARSLRLRLAATAVPGCDDALSADPALRPVIAGAPGQRVPRTVDEHELALRTVLGQQISTAAARTHAARLVGAHGEPVDDPAGGLTRTFPSVKALAELDPDTLAMPAARRRALCGLVAALAAGDVVLDPGSDWHRARHQLGALPGIGPWTVELVAMRALGDPDAFPTGDLGARLAACRLGIADTAAGLFRRSDAWRPWRSYATQYLWTTLDHPVNTWPASARRWRNKESA